MLPFRKILVPTDFSGCAQVALAQGAALARLHGAELHLVHVMTSLEEDPYSLVVHLPNREVVYRKQEALCAEAMRDLIAELDAEGPETFRHLLRDLDAAPAILDFVAERGIDLVVLGAHGRRGLRRFLLGSVAEEVVRLAACPVLTMREASTPLRERRPARILVPVDFSELSKRALAAARELAGPETRIDLVHAVETPVGPPYHDLLHDTDSAAEAVEKYAFPALAPRLEEALARFAGDAGGEGELGVRILEGEAAAAIAEDAEQNGADLIVIATHGFTGLKHLWLGSIAERVVRAATCPVLTVKLRPPG